MADMWIFLSSCCEDVDRLIPISNPTFKFGFRSAVIHTLMLFCAQELESYIPVLKDGHDIVEE